MRFAKGDAAKKVPTHKSRDQRPIEVLKRTTWTGDCEKSGPLASAIVKSRQNMQPAPGHGTALCATGLERSFPEIGRNVAGALRALNHSGALQIFGVMPANASWSPAVYSLLAPTQVALQTPCHAPAGKGDLKWFTCTRGGALAWM